MTVATATVLSDGEPLDPSVAILSLDVEKQVNRIGGARLSMLESSPAEQRFAVSASGAFSLGKQVEIRLRYEGSEEKTLFVGRVVRHAVALGTEGPTLDVELKDAAFKLTQVRRSAVFRDASDDDAIRTIVEGAGLKVGELVPGALPHPELVQYRSTDWDFILARADVQGALTVADAGVVSTFAPSAQAGVAHELEYGVSEIHELELSLDGGTQFKGVESVAWDAERLELTEPTQAEPVALPQGDTEGGDVAEALGFGTFALSHAVPAPPAELQAWADARLSRNRFAFIRGRIELPGTHGFALLDVVRLSRFGARFDGDALVSAIRHRLNQDGWSTSIQLGLSPDWFCTTEGVAELPAGGLVPPIGGLQVGVVAAFEDDPNDAYRVKVVVPALNGEAVWARLATLLAGSDRGSVFRPEPGDEVVLGFFNDDPRHAVILGAMHGSAHPPPESVGKPSEKNELHALVTKKGTTIGFVDGDEPALFIRTAGKNEIRIDDGAKGVTITDQHSNSIVLNEDGVAITSSKDLKIEARGKVEIKGETVDVN
jgi:Rhs element Vgr protein